MQLLISLLLGLSLTGCLSANKRSTVKELGDNLKVTGLVVTQGGMGVEGANIYVDQIDESLAVTNPDGSFDITLDREMLIRIAGKTASPQNHFFVYAEQIGGAQLVGASKFVDLKERGGTHVGSIVIGNPVTVTGMAYVVPQGRRSEPAAGANVSMGRVKASVAADGQFTLRGVASGELPLHVAAQQFAPYHAPVSVLPGEDKTLDEPVFLFPELGIAGALVELPALKNADLVATGHPFLRSFAPVGSRDARYVRYHHDPVALTNRGDQAWLKIPDRFDYDFPGNGGHTLYYQFADETRTKLSDVYRKGIILDLFSDTSGIVIGDGSGIATTRNVLVKVDVPAAAYKMRLADSLDALPQRPWMEAKQLVEFIFPVNVISPSAVVVLGVQREIFCQFVDAMGNESVAFKATVKLNLFPSTGIVIGDGSGTSTNRRQTIHIDVPPAAVGMRLGEDIDQLLQKPWREPASEVEFLFGVLRDPATGFFSVSGARQVFAQFIDASGYMSGIISATTNVLMFPATGPVFQIDGGAPTATTRTVSLAINLPPNAFEMRVFESDVEIPNNFQQNAPIIDPATDTRNLWMQADAQSLYTFASHGPKLLYLQFRDVDGIVSPVYQQAISVIASPPDGNVGFLVNGGATFSDTPHLLLTLIPPANAIAYRVFEGPNVNQTLPWVHLQPIVPYSVQDPQPGPTILRMQYLTVDFATTTTYQQAIDIDPLPAGWGDFSINGGAFSTTSPDLNLSILAPPSASYMAVSQGLQPIDNAVWVPVSGSHSISVDGAGSKVIYLRFKTVDGIVSSYALSQTIFYEPFPMNAGDVEIDGGAATTTSTILNLGITVPGNAIGMRVSHDLDALDNLTFTPALASTTYVIPNVNGEYKVYVQFKNATGELSPAYFDAITKQ
jgi:hypothetical protein